MSAFSLTPKQRSFANNIIKGMNPSEAYKGAGYKTDNMAKTTIATEAQALLNHPNISRMIEAGQTKVSERVEYSLERAVEMAMEDWEKARELGQVGAAVSSNRLASDLMGYLIDRRREINPNEDPIAKLMGSIEGRSRIKPETRH